MYELMLFLHIVGVLLMFIAVGGTLAGMFGMLHAGDIVSLRIWSRLATRMDGFLPFSVILILFPALYLVVTAWGWGIAWIDLSLAILLLMTVAGPVINFRRLKAITSALDNEKSMLPSTNVLAKIQNRTLWNSVFIMTFVGLAIVYLMVIKPTMAHALIAIAVCILLGWLFATIALKSNPSVQNIKKQATHF